MNRTEYSYEYYIYQLLIYCLYFALLENIAERHEDENGEPIYRLNFAVGTDEVPLRKNQNYTQRIYEYDERDRLIHSLDYSNNVYFIYTEDGNRSNKYDDNRKRESLYFNQYWVEHVNKSNRAYRGESIKHIYLNNERLVSKVCTNNLHGATQTYLDYEEIHTYYWHSDHLGSATLITDYRGKEYERIECKERLNGTAVSL